MHKLQVPHCAVMFEYHNIICQCQKAKNYLYIYILSKNTLIVKLELFELILMTTSFSVLPEKFKYDFFYKMSALFNLAINVTFSSKKINNCG